MSCEAVLACLRRNNQSLMLLMDAVLNDPLVDWVPNKEDAAANQVMPDDLALGSIVTIISLRQGGMTIGKMSA